MSTAAVRARNQRIMRWVVLAIVGAIFALPLISMFRYSIRITPQNLHTWDAWKALVQDDQLTQAIKVSLELSVLTAVGSLVLLLPTMIWIRLKVPWARRPVEFICLLPLTIPAIVLVVGLDNVMSWVRYLTTPGPLGLTFPYIILCLPFAYRALDSGLSAIDVNTLSEAARSLGASWWTVITRIIVPNMRSAILAAACWLLRSCSVSSPSPHCSSTRICKSSCSCSGCLTPVSVSRPPLPCSSSHSYCCS